MFEPVEGFHARFTVAANADGKRMVQRKKKSEIRKNGEWTVWLLARVYSKIGANFFNYLILILLLTLQVIENPETVWVFLHY